MKRPKNKNPFSHDRLKNQIAQVKFNELNETDSPMDTMETLFVTFHNLNSAKQQQMSKLLAAKFKTKK